MHALGGAEKGPAAPIPQPWPYSHVLSFVSFVSLGVRPYIYRSHNITEQLNSWWSFIRWENPRSSQSIVPDQASYKNTVSIDFINSHCANLEMSSTRGNPRGLPFFQRDCLRGLRSGHLINKCSGVSSLESQIRHDGSKTSLRRNWWRLKLAWPVSSWIVLQASSLERVCIKLLERGPT